MTHILSGDETWLAGKKQLNGGLNVRIIELNGRVIFQRATFDYRIVAKIKSF